ncbi:MAG: aldehyde dehydrogenase [Candidatus Marinimicrobia bacterium]|nr:aldehyde dehydrogenase [Candidatus Neomarinimicrobiota bacterium]
MSNINKVTGPIRVGLMGFGRIGRNFYRLASEAQDIEIAVISDIGNPDILHYLLQRDSIHGSFKYDARLEQNKLILGDGRTAELVHGVAPGDVAWSEYDVEVVVDATGKYLKRADMEAHVASGAKRVILTNPPTDEIDRLITVGVNEDTITSADRLISAGSSTTNAMALTLQVLDQNFAVERAMMTTVHAYTSDQPLQDTVGSDFRRSRSAAENIIPNDTHSPAWVEAIMPKFKGRVEGIALNVPVSNGSCVDLTTQFATSDITVDAINDAMRQAARKMPGIIEVTDDPVVSSDVQGNRHSMVFDTQATMKSQGRMVKTISWYDNGWGHAARVLDIIKAYARLNGNGGAA